MTCDEAIYRNPLHEQDLKGLADLCANVARNPVADRKQGSTAYALRVEWVRLRLEGSLDGGETEAETSLRKRMIEFLGGVPSSIVNGL